MEPATTWTIPGPSLGEQALVTTRPLMQICATIGKLELTVTPDAVPGALKTLWVTFILTSKAFVPEVGRFATLTFTSTACPAVPVNLGGVVGHVLPDVRVDGAIQTTVDGAA